MPIEEDRDDAVRRSCSTLSSLSHRPCSVWKTDGWRLGRSMTDNLTPMPNPSPEMIERARKIARKGGPVSIEALAAFAQSEIARVREEAMEENKRMRDAIAWACGEAPDPTDGKWFGEAKPPESTTSRPRPYWWRAPLRRIAGL